MITIFKNNLVKFYQLLYFNVSYSNINEINPNYLCNNYEALFEYCDLM